MAWKFPRTAIAPNDDNGFKRWDSGLYREQYQVKHDIALELNPKSICEIGIRAGYSAFAMLSACPAARYVGLDAENGKHGGQGGPWTPWAVEILKPYDATIHIVDTQKLTQLRQYGVFDLIHVDGDHSFDGCTHDLELALEALAPGGTIVVDDMDYIGSVRRAVEAFAEKHGLHFERRKSPRGEALLRRKNDGSEDNRDFRREPVDQARRSRDGDETGDHHAGQGQEGQALGDGRPGGPEGEGRVPGAVLGGGQGSVPAAHCGEFLQGGDPGRGVPSHPERLGLGPRVTLIIASRDEGDEIVRTCESALAAASGPVEIIVIDDGSRVPVPHMPGVRLHRVEEPLGLFAAKRLAVTMASAGNVVISDAHVRFHPGWDAEYESVIGDAPNVLHVAYSSGLKEEKGVIPTLPMAKGTYYGANLVVRRNDPKKGLRILEGAWQHRRRDGAIPCAMGSVYGTSKAWWERVDMLHGLRTWGGQEVDLSLRTWLSGGEVRLAPGVKTAHVFKSVAPYPADVNAIHMNRMLMATVFPPLPLAESLLNELAAAHPRAAKMFDFKAAQDARRRFDCVRIVAAWDALIERFPEIVCEM